MLKNIMPLYNNSILFTERPTSPSNQYHIFFDEKENEWVGILKTTINDQEVNLLKTLYKLVEFPAHPFTGITKSWYDFLLQHGDTPLQSPDTSFRFIQFQIKGEDVDQFEIEAALKGFFSDEVIIIWESPQNGTIIEEKKLVSLYENELSSLSDTLESDFYVKISFYLGKLYPFSSDLRDKFQQEKENFIFAQRILSGTKIITFERFFPAFVTVNLSDAVKSKVNEDLIKVFKEDPELYATIKVFLENNLNASLTAKKLYIHRNTLQYRIDKFVEKSGVPLKDFYAAFTVFLACLHYEQDNMHKN